jgi:hypothetical protein
MCLDKISLSFEWLGALSGLLAQMFHIVTSDDESMCAGRLGGSFDQVELRSITSLVQHSDRAHQCVHFVVLQ